MDKKVIRKRIIAVSLMVIGLLLFILVGQRYYFRDVDCHQIRLEGFYLEDKDSLDVVLLGASEIYNGFSSAEAYRLYGFTSYPFAFATNPAPLWKYEIKEILKHQSPKVLVVEANAACYDPYLIHRYGAIRNLSDAMPLSQNKIDLVNELATESKLSYYMPFFKHHGNWRKNPFNLIIPDMRGYNILRGVYAHAQNNKITKQDEVEPDGKVAPLISVAEEALNDFLDECDASGIEHIIFVRFPHLFIDERTIRHYHRYNRVAEIVRERGYEYVDFDEFREEIGLDPKHDFYDGEHLNGYGNEKMTKYLGKFLVEKYNLKPSELTEKQRSEWEESADYIRRFYKYYDNNLQEKGFYTPSRKEQEEIKKNGGKIIKEIHETMRTMRILNQMGSVE